MTDHSSATWFIGRKFLNQAVNAPFLTGMIAQQVLEQTQIALGYKPIYKVDGRVRFDAPRQQFFRHSKEEGKDRESIQ